jgi:phage terminase large subunit-like protein
VGSKDYNSQKEGVQNVIMKLLPKDRIKDVSHVKSEVIDTIWVIPEGEPLNTPKRDCSKITFKSCDSGVDKFGGAAKRWIHFDEEPPRDIYRECIARIGAGMPLDIWLTMTPIWEDKGKKIGMTWTYREIYQKRDGHRIFTLGVGIEDNIYLSKEQIEDQKKKYFGAEYDIRIKGEFKLLSGNQVFDPQAIERHDITCTEPLKRGRLEYGKNGRIQVVEDERGYLKIWEMPKNGEQYSIGADVGLGVGGDPSSTSVRTMSSLHQVATVNGQIAPDRMGEILIMLGTFYNKAWCGVEANSFGIATLDAMKHRYSKLYYRYKVDQRNDHKTKQIGWWTDTKTKPLMISDYGRAIREDALIFRDTETLDECMTYVIGEDGHANAELGCHDDRVIADMICLQVRKRFHMTSASVELESYVPANKTGGY